MDGESYRREVYEIREDQALTLSEKLDRLLALGCEYLDVDNGHIKRIDRQRAVHDLIASVGGESDSLAIGAQHTHATTFCRLTVEQDSPLAISHASDQGWADDPAYQTHDLECYLGASITVEGITYGTVCFVSQAAQSREFAASERAFVELVAGVVGTEIEATRYEYRLTDRDRLNAVLNRVLRHNLRNTMNAVSGYAETLADQLTGDERELANRILSSANHLVEMGATARRLENVARHTASPERRDLGPLLSSVATELQTSYPEATIDIEPPDTQAVYANEHLQSALYELGENAIIHAETDAAVEISVAADAPHDDWVVIDVDDNGPGLPEVEQNILQGQIETQLEHSQGLDLWFVYWVVVRSGGKLTVTVDDGTLVRVWLPSEDVPNDDRQWYLTLPAEHDIS